MSSSSGSTNRTSQTPHCRQKYLLKNTNNPVSPNFQQINDNPPMLNTSNSTFNFNDAINSMPVLNSSLVDNQLNELTPVYKKRSGDCELCSIKEELKGDTNDQIFEAKTVTSQLMTKENLFTTQFFPYIIPYSLELCKDAVVEKEALQELQNTFDEFRLKRA
ncbi:hypothetical protein QTP88_005176 [Uroleucon formosanum]